MPKGPPPWFFRQAAVIAYRGCGDALSVALVTSRSGRRWVLPKGVIDPGESAAEAAIRETLEEAGLRGTLEADVYGVYTYEKWGGTCHADVFLLDVTDVLDEWLESDTRERRWMTPEEAARLVQEPALQALLTGLRAHLDSR